MKETKKMLYQDNQSAICMEKNGRSSCTGNPRHISIRYLFVKDIVDKDEAIIKYCPSEYMLAEYFTNKLQGKVFRVMRIVIMGWESISWLAGLVL